MRTGDVIGLALLAMWQRKVRTALTVVGVAIGCFVLITSLSVGGGVQDVILTQLRKQDQLRRIAVWPGSGTKPGEPPEDALRVPGEMTEARRERLREAIRKRWVAPAKAPPRGLKQPEIDALARLEHVEAVTPALNWQGKIERNGVWVQGMVRVAAADDPGLRRRLVAGRLFRDEAEPGVLVSEYAAYIWGLRDEASVAAAAGAPVTLTIEGTQPGLANLLFLLNLGVPNLSADEQRVLKVALARLPAALEKLDDLPAEDRATLKRLLGQSRPGAKRERTYELPVVGVFRDVDRSELGPFDGPPRPVDVAVSPGLARQIVAGSPGGAQHGLPQVSVRVTHERHLREVEARIKALGLETFSLAEVVDQVRLNVLLVSIACTFVAVIALIVAGIGITNTMLMSVLERAHEIGVMKAVGAKDGQVLALFLAESGLIGAAGAGLGLLGAWLVSFPGDRIARHVVEAQTPMRLEASVFVFPLWLVVGVPLVVCALTTLAGLYPARRAARIDPIAALRQG